MTRLIIVNVSRNYSLGYPRRAFQRESLFDQLRLMRRDSVVFKKNIPRWFLYICFLVSTNQRHKKLDIDYSREQRIHDYGWNHSDNGKA